jgi:hypothetical protein
MSEKIYDDRIRLSAEKMRLTTYRIAIKKKIARGYMKNFELIYPCNMGDGNRAQLKAGLLSFLLLSVPSVTILFLLPLSPPFLCFTVTLFLPFLYPLPSYPIFTFLSLCFTVLFTITRLFLLPYLFPSDCPCSTCIPTQSERVWISSVILQPCSSYRIHWPFT